MISFRTLTEDDFPTLLEWLQRPHVKEWWDDNGDTLEKIRVHYSEDPETTKRFIMLWAPNEVTEPRKAGYFQYYRQSPGVIGIDQFLSDAENLNRRLGTKTIKEFIGLVIERETPSKIIIDPTPDNHRTIRCYQNVGFKYRDTVPGWNGELVCLMGLEVGSAYNKSAKIDAP